MTITAIYPGTFDPITYGHIDLVKRFSKMFDKIIVAVAASQRKSPILSLKKRLELTKIVLAPYSNVEVLGFDGLAIDFARQKNARIILRGLRTLTDMEYEFQLADMNKQMAAEIETLFLTPAPQYVNVSSSIIREIAAMNGDISLFVPDVIACELKNVLAK